MAELADYQPESSIPDYLEPRSADPLHYLRLLWRRKWLILAVVVLVFSGAVVRLLRTRPVYKATTRVMLEKSSREEILSGPRQPSFYSYGDYFISNQMHILRSRQLKEAVVLAMPDSLLRYASVVFGGDTTLISPSRLISSAGLTVEPLEDTDLLDIGVTSFAPGLAVALVNLYAETFQKFDLDQGRRDVASVKEFIEEQLNVVGRRLDLAEISLEEFKKENRFVNLDAETSALIGQQSNLAVSLAQSETELEGVQARLSHVRGLIDEERAGMSEKLESISSPLVVNFKATLDQLEVERANLMIQGYTDESDRVRNLNAQIADIRSSLALESKKLLENQGFIEPVGRLRDLWEQKLELETDLTSINARRRVLEAGVLDLRSKLRNLPEVERTFAKLSRDVEADRAVYAMLAQRYEEARIQEAGRVSSVRIVDLALNASKVRPVVKRDLAAGLFMALALSLALALVVEYLDTSVKTPGDVERRGLTIFASVPLLPGKARWGKSPITTHLVTHANPSSSGAEAFRVLRTNLLFALAASDKPCSVLLVTSPEPGEGKSTVAVNMAASLAQAGQRTLLIDGDLRAPVLHSVFQHARKPGFTDLVVFDLPLMETVFPAGTENLFCLASGTIPPSPADILSSPKALALITQLRGDFDYIIIDSPPALLAADAAILSSLADATILVVRANSTSGPALQNSLRHMTQSGGRILGAVLNGLKPGGRYGAYYYYYYSEYAYKYRYAKRRRVSDLEAEDKETEAGEDKVAAGQAAT